MTDQAQTGSQLDREIRASISSATTPVPRVRVNSIAARHERLAFAAGCAKHRDAVIKFWYDTMMGNTPNADMNHRIVCARELMNRAYGMPIQITNETVNETRKQILEVRWLPADPADRSKLIEPEPD